MGWWTLATSAPGPREAKNAASAGEITPVACSSVEAWVMFGFSLAAAAPAVRMLDHPDLTVWFLYRLVVSECQAIIGAMASTLQSWEAVANWMPPP